MITIPTRPWAHIPFDLLAWSAAAALGTTLARTRLKPAITRLAYSAGPTYFAAVVLGALPGAWLAGSFNTLREAAATLSHSVAGALAGAIVAVEIYKLTTGIKGSTGAIFVAPFAIGVAIGRWGCFFTGLPDDTYGIPTTLPLGVDFGDGIARHPVQLYESAAMASFLVLYLLALLRGGNWPIPRGFYAMTAWYGAQRFAWEFLKPYPKLFGPFNLFHVICAGLVIYGCVYYRRDLRRAAQAAA